MVKRFLIFEICAYSSDVAKNPRVKSSKTKFKFMKCRWIRLVPIYIKFGKLNGVTEKMHTAR